MRCGELVLCTSTQRSPHVAPAQRPLCATLLGPRCGPWSWAGVTGSSPLVWGHVCPRGNQEQTGHSLSIPVPITDAQKLVFKNMTNFGQKEADLRSQSTIGSGVLNRGAAVGDGQRTAPTPPASSPPGASSRGSIPALHSLEAGVPEMPSFFFLIYF